MGPKFGSKKVSKKESVEKVKVSKKAVKVENSIMIGKLGESQIKVMLEEKDTVYEVLKRTEFPSGTFRTKTGKDITNIIAFAEADIAAGRRKSLTDCIKDIRLNAKPATLESIPAAGDILTLVPDIEGG